MIINVVSSKSELSFTYKNGCAYGIAYWADCSEQTMELLADTFTSMYHARSALSNENPNDYINGQLMIVELHVGNTIEVAVAR